MRHKKLMSIGLESYSSEGVNTAALPEPKGPIVPLIPDTPTDAPFADMSIGDVRGISEDLEVEDSAIDKLDNISAALTEIRNDVISNTAVNGDLSVVSAEAYDIAINHVLRNTGLKNVFVSAEAFGNLKTVQTATTISTESVTEVIKRVIERIIELVKEGVEKISDYITRYLSATERAKRRQKDVREKFHAIDGASANKPTVSVTAAQASWLLTHDDRVDLVKLAPAYFAFTNEIYQKNSKLIPNYINNITDVIRGWVSDPSSFNGENPFGDVRAPFLPNINPKTNQVTDWEFGEWRVRYSHLKSLPTIEWVNLDDEADDDKEDEKPESYEMPTLPLQAIDGILNDMARSANVMGTSEHNTRAINEAYANFGKAIESANKLEHDDEGLVKAISDILMPVASSVRSFVTFPIHSAGKLLNVNAAMCDVLETVIAVYGNPVDDTETGQEDK